MEEKVMFVYPPSKKIRMKYGKTLKQKWIEFLEEQTYGYVQEHGEQVTHVQDTHPSRPVTVIMGRKPVLLKGELTQIWRDENKETKKVPHFKGNQ